MNTKNLERETAAHIVRPYQKEDKAEWVEAHPNQPEKDFVSLLQVSKEQQKQDKSYYLAVIQKASMKIMATVMITDVIRDQYQSAFIGLSSNHKQIGDQVMFEAIAAAMDIAFNDLDLHRLEILCSIHTKISKQSLLTLGMRSEGTRKQCYLWDNKWLDVEVFALVKEEWTRKHVSSLMNATYQMR